MEFNGDAPRFRQLVEQLLFGSGGVDEANWPLYLEARQLVNENDPMQRALAFLARDVFSPMAGHPLSAAESEQGEALVRQIAMKLVHDGEWKLAEFAWTFLCHAAATRGDLALLREAAVVSLGCSQITLTSTPIHRLLTLADVERKVKNWSAAIRFCRTTIYLLDSYEAHGPVLHTRLPDRLKALVILGEAFTQTGDIDLARLAQDEAAKLRTRLGFSAPG